MRVKEQETLSIIHTILLNQAETLEQPNVGKNKEHQRKEHQPDLPANARSLRHDLHPVHCILELQPCRLKIIVHAFDQGAAFPDLNANRLTQLLHHLDLPSQTVELLIVLTLQLLEYAG